MASREDVEVVQKSKIILSGVRANDKSNPVVLRKSIQELLSESRDGQTGDFYIFVDPNSSNIYFPRNVDLAIKSRISRHFSAERYFGIHQHDGHNRQGIG